jgi:hypothetical protein
MLPTTDTTAPAARVAAVAPPVGSRRVCGLRRRAGRSVLAAEAVPVYHATAGPVAGPVGVGEQPPFGLPVLAELPALAGVLVELDRADRAALRAVVELARVLDDDTIATVSGVGVEQWIAIVVRHTRLDRRLLLGTARLLCRLPSLARAAEQGTISWTQLRGLALLLREVPGVLDGQVEGLLERLLPHLEGTDPDLLLERVRRAIVEWQAQLAPDPDPGPASNQLVLQPRLDGTGGRLYGELDTLGLAIIDDATAPTRTQLDHPGGIRGARADNLLTRLTHTCPDPDPDGHPDHPDHHTDPDHPDPDHDGDDHDRHDRDRDGDGDRDGGGHTGHDHDRHDRAHDGDGDRDGDGGDPTGRACGAVGRWSGGVGPLPAVKLLLRCELADLLDATRTPVDVLTRLAGGSLRLHSVAARRLLEARGAQLRTVVVDDGQVVGVGRATRIPPGRLRDIALAVHDTCTGPLCDRPARTAELDHARPWHPPRPDQPGGRTDADNLGPLCAATNKDKERAGWQAHQHPDGRRRWTHPRSGLSLTTTPTTWNPPDPDPPDPDPPDPDRPPDGRTSGRRHPPRDPDPPPRDRPSRDPDRPPDPGPPPDPSLPF